MQRQVVTQREKGCDETGTLGNRDINIRAVEGILIECNFYEVLLVKGIRA